MFLPIAALLLLIVIAVQNYLYPPLREETISDGLYGPYHWFLDGAYVVLVTALITAFHGTGLASVLAVVSSAGLLMGAVTNTFSGWVDRLTGGLHSKLHTYATAVMFLAFLALEATQNHGWMWWLSAAGLALPAAVAALFTSVKKFGIVPGPAAEKTAVLMMCVWLIAWSVVH